MAVGLVGVSIACTLLGAMQASVRAHELRSAADAAAIAAADGLLWNASAEPCELAQRVAIANRVVLVTCRCADVECTVALTAEVFTTRLIERVRAGAD